MSVGLILTLLSIFLSSTTMIFDLMMITFLIVHVQSLRRARRHLNRRIGLLHFTNTYIHLSGILTVLLLMSIRTWYGDLTTTNPTESWHCHFLAYLMSFFAAGVYGSCCLQALFRFWQIVIRNRSFFHQWSFHMFLIVLHWILISILLLPTLSHSVYIIHDYFCWIPFDNYRMGGYISLVTVVLPVTFLIILYINIILYVRSRSRRRQRSKRVRKNLFLFRRILILVIIICQTSCTGILLWILSFFDQRLHPLFYRLLRFLIILCMFICSIGLLIVSPELKRMFRTSRHSHFQTRIPSIPLILPINNELFDETIPIELIST